MDNTATNRSSLDTAPVGRMARRAALAIACTLASAPMGAAQGQETRPTVRRLPSVKAESVPAPPSIGEATSGPSQLDRLTEFAIMQHPELAGARARVSQEAGLRFQATRKPNPWLGYSATEIGNEGRGGQQGLFVAQEWVTAGKLGLADQVGHWKTRAAQERAEVARLRVGLRVGTQYWSLVAARHRVELLRQLEGLLEDAVRINRSLQEAAEIERGTLLQAQLEKGQITAALRQAQAGLRARSAALAATLGTDVAFVEGVPSDPWPEPSLPDDSESPQLGFRIDDQPYATSPELMVAQAVLETARWDLRLAETQVVSNVDSYAAVQRDLVTDHTIVSVQVGMALPLHDRKSGLIRAARAEIARAEADYARTYRHLQSRWADAVGEYRAAWELVLEIEQQLLRLAEERLELARRAHGQGELEYLELLTAQRSFLAIRQAAIDARQQAAIASVRLTQLVVEDQP
ncbi:MAG: TolC family protein [Planctomycetaceae bacterium]|nr:MAG: TolC family protein [Planctomycetaceae bacterium]